MDKLEYIPGDLVSIYVGIKKFIVEVIGIENENEALLYQIKLPNGEIQYADKGNIVPIPLTPEILEKNGWKLDDATWIYKKGYIRVFRLLDGKTYAAYIFGMRVFEFHFIHELQHLLFGLGINSEMEV